MESAQISIPDLDDDEIFNSLPQPPFASAGAAAGGSMSIGTGGGGGGSGSDSARTGSFEDLRGPSRPWLTHGRTGSGTSGESSLGGEASSVAGSRTGASGGWSFPRKTSFASLKAAIKGGNSGNHSSNAAAGLATFDVNGSTGGPATYAPASNHSSFRTFNRTTSANNAREAAAVPVGMSSSSRRTAGGASMHQRNDSQLSGQSRVHSAAPSSSQQGRGHHAQQASYFSEQSLGHASSSGSQAHGMPPLPPFPEQFVNPSVPAYPPGTNGRRIAPDDLAMPYYFSEDAASGYGEASGARDGGFPPTLGLGQSWTDDARALRQGANLGADLHPSARSRGGLPVAEQPDVLPLGVGCPDPHAPSEFALNVLMSRFIAKTQTATQAFMAHAIDAEPSLDALFGSRVDDDYQRLLGSLAHVSRKNPKMVVESLLRWHAMQVDLPVDAESVRRCMSQSTQHFGSSPAPGSHGTSGAADAMTTGIQGVKEVAATLARRKMLLCTYVLAKALIEVAKQLQTGAIAEGEIDGLFSQLFELLQSCSRNRLPKTHTQTKAFDAVAQLLGELSRKYFMSIGDRFISMLEHCAKVQPSKGIELAQETAVEGMRYLSITVFPMEQFEEGAEILEAVARFFADAHGHRVKWAYAQTLTHLILPVAQSASAEINHPTWTKAMDVIAPRAASMSAKPRYWAVAYPLYVAALCAAPEEQFLQGIAGNWGWTACLEAALPRMKDRGLRPIILNSAIRLLWVYMFRCRESSNATTKRLEWFFRQWFPSQRPTVVIPSETPIQAHIEMVHLALYRHFDFGRDVVLEFLRHNVLGGSTLSLQPDIITSQRMIIAVKAVALTLDAHVKSESPVFPASADFSRYDSNGDEGRELGDELPEDFAFPKAEIEEAQMVFNDLIGKIALICDHQLDSASVFDESVVVMKTNNVAQNGTFIEHERYLIRTHQGGRLITAFAREQQSFMDLHRACLESWPRCLSSSIPFASILSCLFRAHWSADPVLGNAASQTLRRIARQRKGGAAAVVSGFGRHIFRAETIFWETHPHQIALLVKVEAAVKVWIEFLKIWLSQLRASQNEEKSAENSMERTSVWAINDEVEAYGLLLLCSGHRHLRRQAIDILRLVSTLDDAFSTRAKPQTISIGITAVEPSRIIHLLDLPCRDFCDADDSQLSTEQWSKVLEWTRSNSTQPLSDLAESDFPIEHSLWEHVLPRFLRMCLEQFPTTAAVFRLHVTNRVLSMDGAVAIAAGLVPRSAATLHGTSTTRSLPTASANAATGIAPTPASTGSPADQSLMAEHWKFYILALCTTTTSTEGSRGAVNAGNHRRQTSDTGSTERVIAARDLFQKLVPFLASDQAKFRNAVVTALGNINVNLYRTLLETLQAVSSQLNDGGGKARSLGRLAATNRRHVRLRTALGHVVQLTSSHMSVGETLSDAPIMNLILHWVTSTFNFLTEREVRSDWAFQQLRRFFCGVVDDLYKGLWPRGDCERYFPFETRLRMFKLFAEWYSYSQSAREGPAKLADLLAGMAEQLRDEKHREVALTSLRSETQALAFHASEAMATLCQGSIIDPLSGDAASAAQLVGTPFEPVWLVRWVEGLLRSSAPTNHAVARRALRSVILNNGPYEDLVNAVIDSAFHETDNVPAKQSLFACFSETATTAQKNGSRPVNASLHSLFVLGLTKLGHQDVEIRRKAFLLIEWAARRELPSLSLHDVEVGVSSPLPATYLRAQREASAFLAERFDKHKVAFVCEATARLPLIDPLRRSTTLGLLPDWLRDIDLLQGADSAGGGSELTYCSLLVLSNLLYLTVRHGDEHNFEIQDAWASLAEGSQILFNANAIVKFLVEQGLCYRSPPFIVHAKRVVSCLSHTIIGPHMFDELCSFIEPSSMIPVPRERVAVQPSRGAHRSLFKCNLEDLLPAPSKQQVFSPGQLAILFVCELTYGRSDRLNAQLPLLLHALFMQMDSFLPFIQEQVFATFEQLLRSLASRSVAVVGAEEADMAKARVEQLFARGPAIMWTHSDLDLSLDETRTPRAMRFLLEETLSVLAKVVPDLKTRWADHALYWATSGPVRHLACRSFQTFRVMLPSATPKMLADMLGRLSNTISDPNLDIQSFSLEILYTLTAIVRSTEHSRQDIFQQIFWGAVACLNTINEREYAVATEMLDSLLDKLDIGDPAIIDSLTRYCPEGWEGDIGGIQSLVLRGLRSSLTSTASFKALMRLAKVQNGALVDETDGRIAFLFVSALPWFVHAADATQGKDPAVLELAQDIAVLCDAQGRSDLSRVAVSIAKSRFRTKDDLIRQAVSSIRSNFLPAFGPQLAIALLSLILNQHEWLRSSAMQVLKIFFQVADTRSEAFSSLGSELLMPLLRLVCTPLASQALDVLDEPIAVFGGPTANQILRMSLQWGMSSRRREHASDASIFGAPDDSGWSVANPQDLTSRTRINTQAVFKTCELTLDVAPVSIVDFVNEDYYYAPPSAAAFLGGSEDIGSLGDIVLQLHELSSFFTENDNTEAAAAPRWPNSETDGQQSRFPVFGAASLEEMGSYLPQASKILGRSETDHKHSARMGTTGPATSAGATMAMALGTIPGMAHEHEGPDTDYRHAWTNNSNQSDLNTRLESASELVGDDSETLQYEGEDEPSEQGSVLTQLTARQRGMQSGPSNVALGADGVDPVERTIRATSGVVRAARPLPFSASDGPFDMDLRNRDDDLDSSLADAASRADGDYAPEAMTSTSASASPSGSRTPRRAGGATGTAPGGSGGSNRRSFFYRKASTSSAISATRGTVIPMPNQTDDIVSELPPPPPEGLQARRHHHRPQDASFSSDGHAQAHRT
ncbi:unnamed protein product [Parajaminaea phylloscopi]